MPLSEIDWTNDARDPRTFLTAWCAAVTDALNESLAGNGGLVAASDCRTRQETSAIVAAINSPAEALAPALVAPARFTDRFGVTITSDGQTAAAVLFVTPDNKSDSDASLAFAVRAAAFLTGGVGVVIVDALPGPPSWATHLHSLVGVYPMPKRPRNGEAPVLVVQPQASDGVATFAVWHHAVATNFPLPTVPVPVRGTTPLKLDLEATYLEACKRSRLST